MRTYCHDCTCSVMYISIQHLSLSKNTLLVCTSIVYCIILYEGQYNYYLEVDQNKPVKDLSKHIPCSRST